MADESRWSDEERFGRSEERRWNESSGPRGDGADWLRQGRTRGEDYRSRDAGGSPYREYGREYGYGRDYGEPYRGYSRDRGEPYRGSSGWDREFRRDAGYGRPPGQGRSGSPENRGWFERAADEVSSWFGDDDAQRRRERDALHGHRGRGPKGYVRSDERIREDVCDRLSDDVVVDASDIDVAVVGSEVTLSGTVQSRAERRRAEDCAERVSGVSHVQNNLRISQPAGMSGAGLQKGAGGTVAKGAGPGPGRSAH